MQATDQPSSSWTPALTLGVLTSLLHLVTASDGWDLFRDELYYVANSYHLGFGYVDHPPMVGWLTWLARTLFGESQLALRSLPALAGGATVVAVSRTAAVLGGGPWAQWLAGAATAFAPAYIAAFGYLSMNSFDGLFWALCVYVFARLLRTRDPKWWIPFGALAGLGLENKISILFLGFGVVAGLLLTRDWEQFRRREIWWGGGIAAVLFMPHLIWQGVHGWPTVEFIRNATRDKILPVSPLQFLAAQWDGMGPGAALLAIVGVAFLLFSRHGRAARALGWAPLAILVFLIVQRSKPYYFAPAWTLLFAAGGAGLALWSDRRGARWLRPVVLVAIVGYGLLAAPLVKPLLSVEGTVSYMHRLGVEAGTAERKEVGRLGQDFADRLGWRDLAQTAAEVYHSLPADDQRRACFFGSNYGQAGAIDHYGRALGLPPAISGHNSYWLWGPGECTGEVLIVLNGRRESLEQRFESVEHAATFTCEDCMPYEGTKEMWIARRLRLPLEQAWGGVKHYDEGCWADRCPPCGHLSWHRTPDRPGKGPAAGPKPERRLGIGLAPDFKRTTEEPHPMRSLRPLVLRSLRLACISALFALGAATAARAEPPPAEAAIQEVVRFDEQTRERVYEFAVEEDTEAVRLTISARVKSGKVTWILEDPEGGHRLSGRGIRGRIRGDTGAMADPPAGTWRLTLSTEHASGWTRFEWYSE